MDNETEVIRQQMQGTRTALSEKLGQLETQITSKVEEATTTVADTVESVTETVGNVKEAVDETVDAVKHTFDLNWHVQRHPWLVVSGAVLLGFVGGRVLFAPGHSHRRERERYGPPPPPPPEKKAERPPDDRHKEDHDRKEEHDRKEGPARTIKALGLGLIMGLVREMVARSVPAAMGQPLAAVVDNLTEKIGGKPLFSSSQGEHQPQAHEREGQTSCPTS